MKWYYKISGQHVHVRVFMSGANCGSLCFRLEEFEEIRRENNKIMLIEFIKDDARCP